MNESLSPIECISSRLVIVGVKCLEQFHIFLYFWLHIVLGHVYGESIEVKFWEYVIDV